MQKETEEWEELLIGGLGILQNGSQCLVCGDIVVGPLWSVMIGDGGNGQSLLCLPAFVRCPGDLCIGDS